MRALVFERYGPPEGLRLVEQPVPEPGPGEVRVRVRAVSLNASDWELVTGRPLYIRMWGLRKPRIQTPGSDIAGEVDAVGAGATRFAPGDAVFGDVLGRFGGLAERVCVPEKLLFPKPDDLSFEDAASLPQAALVALQGIRGRVQPGQRVLINGAGGGSGSFAIQIAKHLGAHVTAVDNAGKLELMGSAGADRVIDYAAQDFTALGERWDLVLDLVGVHRLGQVRGALAPGGTYLIVGGEIPRLLAALVGGPALSLLDDRKLGMLFVEQNQGLDDVVDLVRAGAIRPIVDRVVPLADAPNALRRLGQGRALGKVVVAVTA